MKEWQQRLMGKAMTVTDTKTLWGKDPDKRNPYFLTFHLFELLSFQSAVLPAFAVLTYFCLDNKNNSWGGGGHFHINLYGTCRFSGFIFQHKFLNLI